MTCLQSRRLHDIGRSGWWQLAALAVAFTGAFPIEPGFGGYFRTFEPVARAAGGIAFIAYSAFLIGIGAIRGAPDANRFGPLPDRFD